MIQVYLLSVICNILSGYILLIEYRSPNGNSIDSLCDFLSDSKVKFVVGLVTTIVGILKILSAIRGDLLIIGDLFPALGGGLAGFTILLGFYHSHTKINNQTLDKLEVILLRNTKFIGYLTILTGIVHFFIPTITLF